MIDFPIISGFLASISPLPFGPMLSRPGGPCATALQSYPSARSRRPGRPRGPSASMRFVGRFLHPVALAGWRDHRAASSKMAISSSVNPRSSLDVGVDLPVGRLDLAQEDGLLVAKLSSPPAAVRRENILGEGHRRRVAVSTRGPSTSSTLRR